MPEPVATISQVPKLFGGMESASDFSAFIEAVRTGTLPEYIKARNLTGQQIAELYDYLRTRVRFDSGDTGIETNSLKVFADGLMGLLGAGEGIAGGIGDLLTPGSSTEEEPTQDFTTEMVQGAMETLAQEAQTKGVVINQEDVPVNDYVNQLAQQMGVPPRVVAEKLMSLNPDFPTEGNLGAGTPVGTGIGTYTWKLGDTPQTVEKTLGLPAGTLSAWWVSIGLDPDGFEYGKTVPIPTAYEPRHGETRGEGTMPQVTGAPTAVPGPDGAVPTTPGGTPDYDPASPAQTEDEVLAEMSARALIEMLMPEGASSYNKSKMIGKASSLQDYAGLLGVASGDPSVSREDYFRQFVSEGAPSTDALMEALRSVGSQNPYSNEASEYLGNDETVMRTVMSILEDRMGPYMAQYFLGPSFVTDLEAKRGEARLRGEDKDLIDILMEIGYL